MASGSNHEVAFEDHGCSVYERALGWFALVMDSVRVWHRWPFPVAILLLLGYRARMR